MFVVVIVAGCGPKSRVTTYRPVTICNFRGKITTTCATTAHYAKITRIVYPCGFRAILLVKL